MVWFILLTGMAGGATILATLMVMWAGLRAADHDDDDFRQSLWTAGALVALQAVLWASAGTQLWR